LFRPQRAMERGSRWKLRGPVGFGRRVISGNCLIFIELRFLLDRLEFAVEAPGAGGEGFGFGGLGEREAEGLRVVGRLAAGWVRSSGLCR